MTRYTLPVVALLFSALTACADHADQPTALQPYAPLLDMHDSGTPERCDVGDAQAVFEAFYPGIFAVNSFTIVDDEVVWTVERNGALGDGVVHCQYRLFAGAVPYLADSYEFCAGDVFLGGNQHSINYRDPTIQELLDLLHPDIEGSYRNKAIAELSRLRDDVSLVRKTYFDEFGTEREVGDGGPRDPVATDPTAGGLKPQEMMVTAFRDFPNVVTRQWGFFGKLEAGTYQSFDSQYYDDMLLQKFPSVELVIIPCDA